MMNERTTSERALRVFGRNVTRLREDRGWSIEQLAERAGLSPDVVSAFESGKTSASLTDQRLLGKAFGVAVAELVGLERAD